MAETPYRSWPKLLVNLQMTTAPLQAYHSCTTFTLQLHCITLTPALISRLHSDMERSAFSACTRAFYSCVKSRPARTVARRVPVKALGFTSHRCLHDSPAFAHASKPPQSRDRGPKSNEDTQTDFASLDVLRNTAAPATGVDDCANDGFTLNNQVRVRGSGILLVGGEAFSWRPWLREGRKEGTVGQGGLGDDGMTGRLHNAKGQWHVPDEAWGLLEMVYPKPGMCSGAL